MLGITLPLVFYRRLASWHLRLLAWLLLRMASRETKTLRKYSDWTKLGWYPHSLDPLVATGQGPIMRPAWVRDQPSDQVLCPVNWAHAPFRVCWGSRVRRWAQTLEQLFRCRILDNLFNPLWPICYLSENRDANNNMDIVLSISIYPYISNLHVRTKHCVCMYNVNLFS